MENILSDYQGFDCLNVLSHEDVKTKGSSRLQKPRLRTNS